MKKILLLIDSLGSGGAQRQFVGLACFLKARNYEVHVLTYFNIPFYNYLLDADGISYEVVKGADSHIKRIPLIRKSINKFSPDVVIAYLEMPSLIACVIKIMGSKWKLITSERNTTQHISWYEKLRFNMYRVADFVVPNSFSQERFINNNFPFLAKKTITISNFTDLNHFYKGDYNPCQEMVRIVVAASIFASKNTLGFIKAISLLKERTQKFHITWYGKVDAHQAYYDQCMNLIHEYGIEEYIELLDKTKLIADKYRESDLFCLPSFFEGMPNVICEAMACGLPIVCSDVCDNPIYVKENVNGWLFDPKQPADIADKLYKAITSSLDVKHSYSRQSRIIAENNLSSEKFTDKYILLLNQINI